MFGKVQGIAKERMDGERGRVLGATRSGLGVPLLFHGVEIRGSLAVYESTAVAALPSPGPSPGGDRNRRYANHEPTGWDESDGRYEGYASLG